MVSTGVLTFPPRLNATWPWIGHRLTSAFEIDRSIDCQNGGMGKWRWEECLRLSTYTRACVSVYVCVFDHAPSFALVIVLMLRWCWKLAPETFTKLLPVVGRATASPNCSVPVSWPQARVTGGAVMGKLVQCICVKTLLVIVNSSISKQVRPGRADGFRWLTPPWNRSNCILIDASFDIDKSRARRA